MADTKKGKPDKAKSETVKRESADLLPSLMREVEDKIAVIRNQEVIADADVAALYGVETKRINEAVRNNPDKFPEAYMFTLIDSELHDLRSKISSTNLSAMNRNSTKVFTERGLYMLATILKGERARNITFAIIETFARVRELKREPMEQREESQAVAWAIPSRDRGRRSQLLDLHKETDKAAIKREESQAVAWAIPSVSRLDKVKQKQASKMQHFGEVLTDIVMPDLQTSETESTLEINFFIGKLKHTVKRVRKENSDNK